MKSALVLTALACLVATATAVDFENTLASAQLQVEFDGRECSNDVITAPCPIFRMSVMKKNGELSDSSVLWKYFAVQEIDSEGNVIDGKSVDTLPADYEVIETPIESDDATGTYVQFFAGSAAFVEVCDICDDLSMTFDHWLVETGELSFSEDVAGVDTVAVDGAFKFSMSITNWPWEDDAAANGNKLRVLFRLTSSSDPVATLEDVDGRDAKNLNMEFKRGQANFELLTKAIVGGVPTTVDINMEQPNDNVVLSVEFPHPGDGPNVLVYDPVITASGVAGIIPTLAPLLLASVAALFFMF